VDPSTALSLNNRIVHLLQSAVPCYLFIRVVESYPSPASVQSEGGGNGYKTVPWLTDVGSVKLAWVLIVLGVVGNIAAIVFSATTGGLAWQS
jgi:hypothetical protein